MRFKPAKDPLMRAATRTRYPGSSKTRVAHLREVSQFVRELRNQGFGVTKWGNVTSKHVGIVVKSWHDRGLATKTIKEYLSGVRATAEAYDNNSIHRITLRSTLRISSTSRTSIDLCLTRDTTPSWKS